jgi:hypothetical protein
MSKDAPVYTITFGDQAENHVGMEQLGERVAEGDGFQLQDMEEIYWRLTAQGHTVEWYDLYEAAFGQSDAEQTNEEQDRHVFGDAIVLRLPAFLAEHTALFQEQSNLPMDKHAYMYGRVVNKKARWNLCFDDEAKEPAYDEGRGRVIPWSAVPALHQIHHALPTWFGPKAADLKGEGNYYYDPTKCGIGFHGDTERRKVIALRLGGSLPLYYQWYHRGQPLGPRIQIPMNGGDMYIMSEKAVGTDWKKKNTPTLRHATGADQYTTP